MVIVHIDIKDKELERKIRMYQAENLMSSPSEAIIKILEKAFSKSKPRNFIEDVDKTIKNMDN